MKEIREREDIIITKTDKGEAVVIMVIKDYIKKAGQQLRNTENYGKLQEDATATKLKLTEDKMES